MVIEIGPSYYDVPTQYSSQVPELDSMPVISNLKMFHISDIQTVWNPCMGETKTAKIRVFNLGYNIIQVTIV